ncbi:MAG: DnaB-like helicase N-terminal domain-containing protein, partial [Armatimonadota bacterium]
ELIDWHPNWGIGLTRAQEQIRADVEAIISRRGTRMQAPKAENVSSTPRPSTAVERAEKIVLGALMRGEEHAELVLNNLTPEDFSDELTRNAARAVFEASVQNKGINLPDLLDRVDKEVGRYLSELAVESGGPPITEQVLQDCVTRIKEWELKNKRISDILNASIKNGVIDTSVGPHREAMARLEEFLRKSGKLPEPGERGGR